MNSTFTPNSNHLMLTTYFHASTNPVLNLHGPSELQFAKVGPVYRMSLWILKKKVRSAKTVWEMSSMIFQLLLNNQILYGCPSKIHSTFGSMNLPKSQHTCTHSLQDLSTILKTTKMVCHQWEYMPGKLLWMKSTTKICSIVLKSVSSITPKCSARGTHFPNMTKSLSLSTMLAQWKMWGVLLTMKPFCTRVQSQHLPRKLILPM